jgi:4-amino-4-deoxy-L-arabinose transferase-like glycosyltransferase
MTANARRLAFLLLGLGLAAIGQSYFDRKIQFYDALWLFGLGLGLAVLIGLRQVAGEQGSRGAEELGSGGAEEHLRTSAPLHLRSVTFLLAALAVSLIGVAYVVRRTWPAEVPVLYLLSLGLFVAAFLKLGRGRIAWPRLTWEDGLAIGVIVLALVLRAYHLDTIPPGFWGDEGNDAIEAQDVLQGRFPSPFNTDWGGNPAMKAYVNALSFLIFGQNIFGLRMVGAIAGTLSIAGIYLLGRELFGPRPALLGSLFLTLSRWHIHRSRYDTVVMQGVPIQVFGYYFLLKGFRTGRDSDFAWSGLLFGFSLNFYHGNRIAPIIIALLLLYEFGRRGLPFLRRYFRPLVVCLLAALLLFAPLGAFYITTPQALIGRADTVWLFNNRGHLGGMYGPHSDVEYVLLQIRDTLFMLNVSGDPSPVVNWQRKPMVDSLTAIFLVLGVAYGLWHWRERRYFFLLLWPLLTLLLGSAFTIGAPNGSRTVGAIPGLLLWAGVGLDLVWRQTETVLRGRWRAALLPVALALFLLVGYVNINIYRQYVSDPSLWSSFAGPQVVVANYLKTAGPNTKVYFLANPAINQYNKVMKFISGGFQGQDFWDAAGLVPIQETTGQDVLYYLPNAALLPSLQWFYPQGVAETVKDPFGRDSFVAFRVSAAEIARRQGLIGRYYAGADWQGSPVLERKDAALSFDWSAETPLPLPFSVEWQGTLYAAQTGWYVFRAEATGELQVTLDGAPLLPSVGKSGTTPGFWLVRGLHPLTVRYRARQPGMLRLSWRPEGVPQEIATTALYTLPTSPGLLGRYYKNTAWSGEPALQQIDPFLYFHWERDTLDPLPGILFSAEWRGKLQVARAGRYDFSLFSCGASWLLIDEQMVVDSKGSHWLEYRNGSLDLTAGEHSITIRHTFTQGPRVLEVQWTPPGGQREIIPAWVLSPPP